MGDCVIDYQGCRSMISCQISGEHDIWWNLLKHELSGWLVAFDLHFHNNMWALQCTKTYIFQYPITEFSPNIDLTHSERKKHSGEQGMYHLYQVDSIKMIKSSDHSPHQKYLTNSINTFIISTEGARRRPLTYMMTIPFHPSKAFCSTTPQKAHYDFRNTRTSSDGLRWTKKN